MFDALMRALHVTWWVPFVFWFTLYATVACAWIINGYAQEYLGWRHPGRPGKIHKVLVRFHTGLHIHPDKSYGDERARRITAGGSSKATAEGTIVYWNQHSRKYRAIRNNLIIFLVLIFLSLMVDIPAATVRALVVMIVFVILIRLALVIYRLRQKYVRTHPHSQPAYALTKPAKAVFAADDTTVGARPVLEEEKQPELEGVPRNVLANLLAPRMGCSAAEILTLLKMSPERGEIRLPDTFGALQREREPVEEVIAAHTVGKVSFRWLTTQTPRTLTWVPVVEPKLPTMARFRDYLPEIEALGPREFGIGAVAGGEQFALSHNGDNPFWCRFAGSGTGKSIAFLVKACQICHKDPTAELYCIDTKQVSFKMLHGIPGVHIFDNPVSEMDKIYKVFYTLHGIMRDRYTAMREGRAKPEDFHDIWILVDEGNDLGASLKSYWKNTMGESSASPAVWGEAVGPLIRQGREARMFGEWMFQDLRDQAMGGESLKFGFNVFGAAGFSPPQFARTIGNPAEECIDGPGRILMCRGKRRTWVQGYYDEPEFLREYALANRRSA